MIFGFFLLLLGLSSGYLLYIALHLYAGAHNIKLVNVTGWHIIAATTAAVCSLGITILIALSEMI